MKTSHSNSWIWVGIPCVAFIAFIGNCPLKQSVDPQKLPGVWRSSDQGIEMTWTFSPDGSFRYQAQFQNGWINLVAGNIDVGGRWRLEQDQLTIVLTGTPPLATLAGANWNGQATTFHIRRLTKEELTFSDSELKFGRSLLPAAK